MHNWAGKADSCANKQTMVAVTVEEIAEKTGRLRNRGSKKAYTDSYFANWQTIIQALKQKQNIYL